LGEDCAASAECCGDLVCTSGVCQVANDSDEPPDDDEVTQLPDTGVGTTGDDRRTRSGLAALAAGAAALLAGKKLRQDRDTAGKGSDVRSND
jgi:hypothetical protein